MAEAGKPTTKTLRPDLEESVDFEKSENVFITGDNLEVLKILQESYMGKIDMIYIDPPYNTGKDFVYSDKFQKSEEELLEDMDLLDEQDQKKVGLTKNEKTSARYHSDWLNMMYPRLVLAKNLLKESGVIFISIDDNEQANLKAICDEIFGEENFVACLVWSNKEGGGSSDSKHFRIKHENIMVYSKEIDSLVIKGVEINNLERYKENDEYRGKYYLQKLGMGSIQYSESLDYPILCPDGTFVSPADNNRGNRACWRWSKSKLQWGIENHYVVIKKDREGIWTVYTKQYLEYDNDGNKIDRTQRPMGIIEEFSSTQGSRQIQNLFGKGYFDYPKDVNLINYLMNRIDSKDFRVFDFFAGSASTADAVMQLNAEDGGNRKYILCTLDEEVAEKSAAKEAGYQTIDQISRERIRRAAQKIQEEHPETIGKQDVGFRAYRLDSSNFKEVGQKPGAFTQENLFDSVSNIKEGRSDFDLLFQIMLNWGMELSLPIVQREIDGIRVFDVAEGSLFACFADEMTESVIRKIAKERPLRAVFKDESFANSAGKINLMQIFKEESPETKVKVV